MTVRAPLVLDPGEDALSALRAGTGGFRLENSPPAGLRTAIRTVAVVLAYKVFLVRPAS